MVVIRIAWLSITSIPKLLSKLLSHIVGETFLIRFCTLIDHASTRVLRNHETVKWTLETNHKELIVRFPWSHPDQQVSMLLAVCHLQPMHLAAVSGSRILLKRDPELLSGSCLTGNESKFSRKDAWSKFSKRIAIRRIEAFY